MLILIELVLLRIILVTLSISLRAVSMLALAVVTVAVLSFGAAIAVLLSMPVLVPAVHPALLALAVMARAVGALHDAGRAVGTLVVTVALSKRHGASGLVQQRHQEDDDSDGRDEEDF